MRVFDFFQVCPTDHDITIYFNISKREIFLRNKYEMWNQTKSISFEELNEVIDFIHADTIKSFYITTKTKP